MKFFLKKKNPPHLEEKFFLNVQRCFRAFNDVSRQNSSRIRSIFVAKQQIIIFDELRNLMHF